MYKLSLENITKKYKNKTVISNLNLGIKEGEILSILGPSGCGKSTLLNIIAGIIGGFDGRIILNGKDISNLDSNKRNVVVVSQENLLFPHMNVYDNISFGLKVRKMDKKSMDKIVGELLDSIGLSGYEKKKISTLSGGEKQRISLARALAINPEILLLDETFSSLDLNLREKIRELTKQLHKKYNMTTILVTHDREEAMEFSDRIALMLNGEIKIITEPKYLYEKIESLDVAKFLMNDNYIDCNNKTIFIKPNDLYLHEVLDKNVSVKAIVLEKKYSNHVIKYSVELLDDIRLEDVSIDKGIILNVEDISKTDLEVSQNIYIEIKGYNIFEN